MGNKVDDEESQNTSRYAFLISSLILGAFPNRLEAPSADGFRRLPLTFLVGLGYYSKFGTTFAADEEDLKESFAYFNNLDPKAKNIRQKINAGQTSVLITALSVFLFFLILKKRRLIFKYQLFESFKHFHSILIVRIQF